MISFLTAWPSFGHSLDASAFARHEQRAPSRLDVQRHALEHTKMFNLHLLTLDQHQLDSPHALARRQMLAEARAGRVSFASKMRHSIGQSLISIGERIRPGIAQGEPTFNA